MKPQSAPSVILVGVDLGLPHFDAELEELGLLAQTAGLQACGSYHLQAQSPGRGTVCGKRKGR